MKRHIIILGILILSVLYYLYKQDSQVTDLPNKPPANTINISQKHNMSKEKYTGNTKIKDFLHAKKTAWKIYNKLNVNKTFYCGCTYGYKTLDLQSCDYQIQHDTKRATRVEWEHIVPASLFGKQFSAWRNGHTKCDGKKGRTCARIVSEEFNYMESDLHNLVPVIGEVNALRENYSMGIIKGERRDLGSCDIEISNNIIEPAPDIRGDIARIYLYMNDVYPKYNIIKSSKELEMFKTWSKEDPVDKLEIQRNELIIKYQGNSNHYISASGTNY